MATRDLTTAYIRLRSAMNRRRPGDGGPGEGASVGLAGAGAGSIDSGALGGYTGAAPVYVELVTDIGGDINALAQKMDVLARAHEARLRISFDPAAEADREREIEILTSEVTRGFNRTATRIKRVDEYSAGSSPEAGELKIRANIKRGLATRLHELSGRFRGMQKVYLAHMTKLRSSSSMSALIGATAGGAGGGEADRDTGFTDEQMHELATAEEDVDERMREIQRIAKSVEELAVLFKELAVLIVEQGTILDRIDHNMEQAVERTEAGVKELVQADKYQKSARPIMCMAILMVLIIICVIIIIAKAGGKK